LVFVSQVRYPPFEFIDENLQHEGMMLDVVRWIAVETGFQPVFLDMPFQQAQDAVLSGKADILTSLFHSEKREEKFVFTSTLYDVPASIFVDAERTDIKNLTDLNGKTIAIQRGDHAKDFLESQNIRFQRVDTQDFVEAIDAVRAGKADAVIGDEQIVLYYIFSKRLADRFKKVGEPLYIGKNCMASEKNNAMLVDILNKGIQEARKSGVLNKISKKWLGTKFSQQQSFIKQYLWPISAAGGGLLLVSVGVWTWNVRLRTLVRQRTAEIALREKKYRHVFDSVNDAIIVHDMQGQILEVNPMACDYLGYTYEELTSMTIAQVEVPGEEQRTLERFELIKSQGDLRFENVCRCKDGTSRSLEVNSRIISWEGQPAVVMSVCRDITTRKRAEAYREMLHEILQILNDPGGLKDCIQRVLNTLKMRTGFDAVAIRLQDGEDFPYFAQKGFPQDFYMTENTLMRRAADGAVCRDKEGKVRLECTCGLVISGKFDPASPSFTPGGSFWVNDSTSLLEISPGRDFRFQPRNKCIHYGYVSFALVPIRNNDRIVGLMQFNDHRKGCFTLNSIEILEGIASHIGGAMTRKQAEEALRAEQTRLTNIIDFLPDATFAIDTAGRVIIWNKAMEEMTGLPAVEMIGKGHYAYAIPFFGEQRKLLIDLIFAESEEIATIYPHSTREGDTLVAQTFCKSIYRDAGAWFFAKASPLRDQFGNITGAIESIRDITDSKQTEEELRAAVARFKALFNATADSVILVKPDGIILDLNENAAYRRNADKNVMRGQSLFDFLPQESAAVRRRAIDQVLKEGKLVQYDEPRDDKLYSIRLFPIRDDQGNVVQVASFSKDITESLQAEEKNRELQAQLIQAQKMEAIGTLAGGIAHDFNNILGSILGYTEIAIDCIPTESVAAKYLKNVLKSGHRAAALVKQILAFSRQAKTESGPLNPAQIVKEAVNFLRPSLPSTIEIRSQMDTACSLIFADPTQVHQIMMNLCTNAFHAMEQAGGILNISLKDERLSREDLQHQPDVQPGTFVVLSIGDTGPGIAPEILNRIFDPYFTTKEVGKGTGMGLSIVHGIVTNYGGFITIDNNLDKGAVFRVYFPAIDDEIVSETEHDEAIPSGTGHVLFVDDEGILTELGKAILESLGYSVTVQTSSLKALATFQERPYQFDAVITDQTMPGMTGMDLAKKILQVRPDIPIILCTGYSTLINEKQAKAEGIREFALKPLIKPEIAALLKKVLSQEKAPV